MRQTNRHNLAHIIHQDHLHLSNVVRILVKANVDNDLLIAPNIAEFSNDNASSIDSYPTTVPLIGTTQKMIFYIPWSQI